jgi:hypothetical protein
MKFFLLLQPHMPPSFYPFSSEAAGLTGNKKQLHLFGCIAFGGAVCFFGSVGVGAILCSFG